MNIKVNKKRVGLVAVLLILVIGIIYLFTSYNQQLEETKGKLADVRQELKQTKSEMSKTEKQHTDEVVKLEKEVKDSKSKIKEKESDLNAKKKELDDFLDEYKEYKDKTNKQLKEAKDEVKKQKAVASRGKQAKKTFTVEATAYTSTCEGCSGITKTGVNVKDKTPNIIAVDPKVIPLGSKVEIIYGGKRLGYFTAEDTGGDIKGYRIDILTKTEKDAYKFGRKQVTLRIL